MTAPASNNPVRTTFALLREFSVPLIAGIVLGVLWANLQPQSYHALMSAKLAGLDLHFLVNELFMAVFFGIAAVEITDSFVPGGSMNPPSKAVTPLLATIGGVVVPAGIYFFLNAIWGSPDLAHGWGITTATDIALAWLVARMVFGKGHPAISFLLLLAIGDDAIGLAIIAVFYSDPGHPTYLPALPLVALGVLMAWLLRRFKVANYWPYLLLGGTCCWLGLHWAHLHPALALVFVVPFMPHSRLPAQESVFDVPEENGSTLTTFEHEWKVIVDVGLLFFGLVNAGVEFSSVGHVTWFVMASLLIGKTIGIVGFGLAARLFGSPPMQGITTRDLLLVGMIAGIGLTVALFVAGVAFTDPQVQGAAKMGALASILVAPLALLAGRVLRG
jgi:NhaA family Na+:H+ antiporter